jgi:hypothetical protein
MRALAFVLALAGAIALTSVPTAGASDPWTTLRRPLRIPHIPAGSSCPLTQIVHRSGQSISLGAGPAYPVGLGRTRTLLFLYPVQRSQTWYPSRWSGNKVLWTIAPRYGGRLLIRGRQLDGPNLLRFEDGAEPLRELRLPPGGPTSVSGYRDIPSFTRVRAPGCYAWQVDGTTFSRVIVFRAAVAR